MSGPRIGELFAGYGGLGMGVQAAYGGEVVWVSEFDKGPSKILAHRFPGVPNHGDITKIDWSTVEPVDILTGGSPCQDLSHAGRRAGMTEGTRSNLWVAMREAIAQLRPSLVVWENVGGAASAAADSEVEPCAGCVGDGTGVHLRALGRVVGDLSSLGYDCRFVAVRASDVGAPHGRLRYILIASDANGRINLASKSRADLRSVSEGDGRRAAAALLPTPSCSDTNGAGVHGSGGPDLRTAVAMLPTPRATDGTKGGPNQRGSSGDLMLPSAVARMLPTPTTRDHKDHTIRREPHRPDDVDTLARALTDVPCALLSTPAVNDMGEGKTVDRWDEWTADMQAKHGNGNGHGKSLAIEAQRLLPTPRTANNENRQSEQFHGEGGNFYGLLHNPERWGDYAAAIARWERILGRPAPAPTMTSTKGNPQLSPAFVEWMMGLPAGWVTDVPGITRNEALKALGNGVVPQQAAEALRVMAGWVVAA